MFRSAAVLLLGAALLSLAPSSSEAAKSNSRRSATTTHDAIFESIYRRAGAVTTDPSVATGKAWDYVVVGGGLAGLTVANRLTENPNISVLVVEAGADTRNDWRIRSLEQYGQSFNANNTDLNWRYLSTNGKLVSAGKGLGGSTSINGCAWTRGSVVEIDNIGRLGNAGFDYNTLLTYMNKAENFTIPDAAAAKLGAQYNATAHGYSGPVSLRYGDIITGNSSSSSPNRRHQHQHHSDMAKRFWTGPQQDAFVQSCRQALPGMQVLPDINSGKTSGVVYFPNNCLPGPGKLRSSSAIAYLSPIEFSRPNLAVLTTWRGWKLLWAPVSGSNLTATGVVIQQSAGGATYNVTAKREVIVAAGAIKSPVFLEHSGVGNSSVLAGLGIPTRISLPGVGLNLQEQTNGLLGIPNGTYPYGGTGPGNVVAFPNITQLFPSNYSAVKTSIQNSYNTWASQAVAAGAAVTTAGLIAQWKLAVRAIFVDQVGLTEFLFTTGFPTNSYGIQLWPLLPFSRGYVHALSSDAFANVTLNPRYFSVPIDTDIQVASSRAARRVLQAQPLVNISSGPETKPGFKTVPDNAQSGSFAAWASWISKNFGSVAHPIATCAMMPRANGGVVDASFKVYGTRNVRVVDAAALPMQISAHLSSTLYGMAEKAADAIKASQV